MTHNTTESRTGRRIDTKPNADAETGDNPRRIPTERLLESVRAYYETTAKVVPPTKEGVVTHSGYSYKSYERLGLWDDVVAEAGIKTLPEIVEDWLLAEIRRTIGTSTYFRSKDIATDLDDRAGEDRTVTSTYICREGIKPLVERGAENPEAETLIITKWNTSIQGIRWYAELGPAYDGAITKEPQTDPIVTDGGEDR